MKGTKELDKVKPEKVTLKIGGKEREIKFGFSAWAELERKYGGIRNLEQMEKDMKEKPFQTIPSLVWIGLRDKEGLEEDTVLDDFSMDDVEYISEKLALALYGSLPQEESKKKAVEAAETK